MSAGLILSTGISPKSATIFLPDLDAPKVEIMLLAVNEDVMAEGLEARSAACSPAS
jgi:hypothetical protein